ncbi:MAG: PadR family transcriptional regulator [Anaerolineae bacterium]|nr:PadR family transcriptional regulator [Anaerolineae bacterium]
MTDAELAILSLLAEGPYDDHELHRLIEARGLRRWTAIGNSSMYYVLEKLTRQGLISHTKTGGKTGGKAADADGEPARRVYSLTPAGTGVLQTAVADLLGSARSIDRSFELGLANLGVLRFSQIEAALLSRQQDLAAQLARLQETVEATPKDDSFEAKALFSHRMAMIEAEIAWLGAFIEEWRAQAPAEPEITLETAIIPRSRQVILPQDPDSIHKHATRPLSPNRRQTRPGQRTAILPRPDKPSPKPDDTPGGKSGNTSGGASGGAS